MMTNCFYSSYYVSCVFSFLSVDGYSTLAEIVFVLIQQVRIFLFEYPSPIQ